MGLFDAIFGRRPAAIANEAGTAFETLTAYRPAFTTFNGQLYENELIRASVDAIARHSSKLQVTFNGVAKGALRTKMRQAPNGWQTWGQFLYRTRTILELNNTAIIVPVLDEFGRLSGYFPVLPTQCEIVDFKGVPYLKYTFSTGKKAAIEWSMCGVITKMQYKDDAFGDSNSALNSTMELLNMQNQGITEGVKNGATFRFMAEMTNFLKPKDLADERKRFNRENLQGESGGILLFPNTYKNVRQIDQKPFVVDHDQMQLIQSNVYNYFGVNEDILQNKSVGDAWNAFYEGNLEPFAVQLGAVMTRMTYTANEIANGNEVFVTANRLQYMSNKDKLEVSSQLLDRGIMNRDEVREIWNLPPLPNGEGKHYVMLAEYTNAAEQAKGSGDNKPVEPANDNGGDQDESEA